MTVNDQAFQPRLKVQNFLRLYIYATLMVMLGLLNYCKRFKPENRLHITTSKNNTSTLMKVYFHIIFIF